MHRRHPYIEIPIIFQCSINQRYVYFSFNKKKNPKETGHFWIKEPNEKIAKFYNTTSVIYNTFIK